MNKNNNSEAPNFNRKYLAWIILCIMGIFACAVFVAAYIANKDKSADPPSYANEITLAQVQKHNTKDSCWLVVGAKVYDVSPNIVSKPDNNKYIAHCGEQFPLPTDGPSKELSDLHKQLDNYYIGILVP